MDSRSSTICAEHFGIIYHFCSEQCQQNFLAHPKLYVGMHSAKKKGQTIIKERKFRVGKALEAEQVEHIQSTLMDLMGIQRVDINGDRIDVVYDLLEVSVQHIQAVLEDIGVALGPTWAARLKLAWIEYVEENELDNLSLNAPACCNKPPAKG